MTAGILILDYSCPIIILDYMRLIYFVMMV